MVIQVVVEPAVVAVVVVTAVVEVVVEAVQGPGGAGLGFLLGAQGGWGVWVLLGGLFWV